jgi:adenylate cyclase
MTLEAARKALLAKPRKMKKWVFLTGMGVTLLLSVLTIYKPTFFRFLEGKIYDTQMRAISSAAGGSVVTDPVIVVIDEDSLAEFGQWPWPRYRLAALIDRIRGLGASGVGLDMLFPEADRSSLSRVEQEIQREFGVKTDIRGLPDHLMDNDRVFARALSRGPFSLGYYFVFSKEKGAGRSCLLRPAGFALIGGKNLETIPQGLFKAQSVTCNIRPLAEAATSAGFFNVIPDADGVLRRVPLLIEYDGRLYPSLSLATFMQSRGISRLALKCSSGRLEAIVAGRTSIPVDSMANLLIRFRGAHASFPRISARDVLHGRVSREQISGRTVFLGTSATGLDDYHTTPVASGVLGVDIHAAVMDNFLRGDFISRPDWVPGMELFLVVVCGVVAALLLCWTRSVVSLGAILLSGFLLWLASTFFLSSTGVFVSPLFPLMVLACNFSFMTFHKYLQEESLLKERTNELVMTQNFTIQCLAALTETRDSETGGHILRCQQYVKLLATRLSRNPRFSSILDEETIELLYRSAPLHDIGKVGIPDSILLKPASLTADEYSEMKKHTLFGREAIQKAEHRFGKEIRGSFLQFGKVIAYSHHEKWDGTGYPEGLTGDRIPLFGRIMAIADVYDALISKRRYKPSFTHEEAVSFIAQSSGTHFDPEVVAVFCEIQEEFRRIVREYPD